MSLVAMNIVQDSIFKEDEGDRWYCRNKANLDNQNASDQQFSVDINFLSKLLEPFHSNIHKILEIGCSNGRKLQSLCHLFGASGNGIDPSSLAVADGNERMSEIPVRLTCGTADSLPFESGKFDLVYFGFCLYLLDRNTLLQAIAEADRVLKRGGFLAITDFDPGTMQKRPYVHREGIFSYKQDYSKFYLDNGLYYLIAKNSFSHRQAFFDPVIDERLSVSLLYKETDPYPLRDVNT